MSSRRELLAGAVAVGAATVAAPGKAVATPRKRTGLMFDMLAVRGLATGDAAGIFPADPATLTFPGQHFENWRTKLEIFNLLEATHITRSLERIEARRATRAELLRAHTAAHIDNVNAISARERGGYLGQKDTLLPHNGHIIAELAFGGAIKLAQAVWNGDVQNGYMLMRPPGHHATRSAGMGFCTYNNLAGAALALLEAKGGPKRILVLDYDVHHGNGTYDILKDDQRVVIVDIHQSECFPPNSGHTNQRGGHKNVLNLDLSPGVGHETALYAMDKVVLPAIQRFKPEIILVSSGFDSGITDPLGRFMFGPMTYRAITQRLLQAASGRTCKGRVVMFHEGGYEENFVPECGLAVIEQLAGIDTGYEFVGDAVTEWQNAGIKPPFLALYRKAVDEVAAFVPELPAH